MVIEAIVRIVVGESNSRVGSIKDIYNVNPSSLLRGIHLEGDETLLQREDLRLTLGSIPS